MLKAWVIAIIFDIIVYLVVYALNLPINNFSALVIGVLGAIIGAVILGFLNERR